MLAAAPVWALALSLALVLPAVAATVGTAGVFWTVQFGGNVEGSDVPGLTAEARFSVLDFLDDELTLGIELTNTSDPSVWESARISAIAFDTDPELAQAEIVSGIFTHALIGGSLPNGFGPVDFCASNSRKKCHGQGGLELGQSGQVKARLIFDRETSSVDFSNYGVRYQSLESEELDVDDDDSGTGRGFETSAVVPEPGTPLLFGAGALLLARSLRRSAPGPGIR